MHNFLSVAEPGAALSNFHSLQQAARTADAEAGTAASESKPSRDRGGPTTLLAVVLGYLAVTAVRVALEHRSMRTLITSSDFDGTEAQRVLNAVCALGPRVAGTRQAEDGTVSLLLAKILLFFTFLPTSPS